MSAGPEKPDYMSAESIANELVSLTADAREHLTYLHELGIEGINREVSQPVAASVAIKQSSLSPAAALPPAVEPVGVTLFGEIKPQPATLVRSAETFEDIHAEIGNCTRCPLYERRTHIVHTEGNRSARLMFIGEAPGADEDAQARPFVGRAGQLLTKIIESIGFKREEVLIGNVNRCRPPQNRPPTPDEAATCKPFLLREIAAVGPEVIVVLGNTATQNLLGVKQGISRLRGQFQDYQGVKVMPTFHPAYLLRDPSKKKETWEDLKKVRDYLESTPPRH
ncbi:MAG TPA: uracil-DNA glycosylase [Pyrinomonadaceae bacterium]|nr:uracil-DNA glycosylase [Pyrinomonadaceae bacterium]